MNRTIDDVINALDAFVAGADDGANELALYDILDGFQRIPERERAIPAMFQAIERYPEADLGCPGPLVHEMEAIGHYEEALVHSLRRQPTDLTVWMVNRILNSALSVAKRASWLAELRKASVHPRAPHSTKQSARSFSRYQKKKSS